MNHASDIRDIHPDPKGVRTDDSLTGALAETCKDPRLIVRGAVERLTLEMTSHHLDMVHGGPIDDCPTGLPKLDTGLDKLDYRWVREPVRAPARIVRDFRTPDTIADIRPCRTISIEKDLLPGDPETTPEPIL